MAGPLIELLKGCFMSNSHQLASYNYWVMDKTKGAEGNLHNKREAADSTFYGTLTAKNGRFCVAGWSSVCSRKSAVWLSKANLLLLAAAHRERVCGAGAALGESALARIVEAGPVVAPATFSSSTGWRSPSGAKRAACRSSTEWRHWDTSV